MDDYFDVGLRKNEIKCLVYAIRTNEIITVEL